MKHEICFLGFSQKFMGFNCWYQGVGFLTFFLNAEVFRKASKSPFLESTNHQKHNIFLRPDVFSLGWTDVSYFSKIALKLSTSSDSPIDFCKFQAQSFSYNKKSTNITSSLNSHLKQCLSTWVHLPQNFRVTK